MKFLKKNYGWILVAVFAILPSLIIFKMINIDISNELPVTIIESSESKGKSTLEMLYHISGEFAIRWMTAVLTCTPFFIVFGITNLYVRQAMGIAAAVWSFLHFIIFIVAEGFGETFNQVNYVAGFIAILILIPLFFTSNRRAIRLLKTKWKKIQSFAYGAILLSILHVIILDKTWLVYAIILGIGFFIRIPFIKSKILDFRKKRKANKMK